MNPQVALNITFLPFHFQLNVLYSQKAPNCHNNGDTAGDTCKYFQTAAFLIPSIPCSLSSGYLGQPERQMWAVNNLPFCPGHLSEVKSSVST